MKSDKRNFLEQAKIYCVLDAQVAGYDQLFDILSCAAEAGADVFQIRDKYGEAQEIIEFSKEAGHCLGDSKIFIVNDDVNLAIAANADGVHLGQEDMSIDEARKVVGPEMIIGISCQTLEQALKAQEQGADYIGFGSVFKTQTKPDRSPMDLQLLRDVLKNISIPVFPIGGISLNNLDIVKECGADRIAVTRALCLAPDVFQTVHQLRVGLTN